MHQNIIFVDLIGFHRDDFAQTHSRIKEEGNHRSVPNAQKIPSFIILKQSPNLPIAKGKNLHLRHFHVFNVSGGFLPNVPFPCQISEKSFEDFQKVIYIPRFASAVIHHGKKSLDVDFFNVFHILNLKLTEQEPLQILQLLPIVVNRLW